MFAAASTTNVLRELAARYEQQQSVQVRLNFAASSTLARQIAAGMPGDLVLLADEEWMDHLAQHRLLRPKSRQDLLANQLVLITPKAAPFDVRMSPAFDMPAAFCGRLALGDPEHVPAGKYAREALESLGWYDALRPRLIPCDNVRAALTLVERGEAAAGIVYLTDAQISSKVRIAAVFPSQSHRPIRFPVALLRNASAEGEDFLRYLTTPAAAEDFARHGFSVTPRRGGASNGTGS